MTELTLSDFPRADQERAIAPDPLMVSCDELLMRRILDDPKQYRHGKVLHAAFMPRKHGKDKDGISLHRRVFADAIHFKLSCTDEKIRLTCGVVDLPVSVFVHLALTVVPDTQPPTPPELPGHVAVKEINSDYHNDTFAEEQRIKVRGYAAELASQCKTPLIVPGKPA